MTRGAYRTWLLCILGAAFLLQAGLSSAGFHRISADEGARALMALGLSWENALQPWIWPPFYKLFVGLALKPYADPFVVPRLLASAAGILVLLALARLAHLLFQDRLVALVSAALAVVVPQRLVLSVAPLSDIYYFLFVLGAAACTLSWLRGDGGDGRRTGWLLAGCGLLMLAQTVRYEACVFAFVLGLMLLHRWAVRREISFGTLAACGVLLSAFPLLWAANSYAWYGSLSNLSVTRQQFEAIHGRDLGLALRLNPLGSPLLLDLAWNPALLLGAVALVRAAARDAALRAWVLAFGLPLPLVAALMVASLSIPLAAPWRITGTWVLLLTPFGGFALVRLAEWCVRRWASVPPASRRLVPAVGSAVAATVLLTGIAAVGPAARSALIVRSGMRDWEAGGVWRRDREAGLFVRDELARLGPGGGQALIDSHDNLEYLHVLVGSTVPDRFVLTQEADPQEVALHLPMRSHYRREGNEAMLAAYARDRFALDRGGSAADFARRDIRLVLAREPRFVAALDASPLVSRGPSFGAWVAYRVRPEALRQGMVGSPEASGHTATPPPPPAATGTEAQ